MAGLTQAQLNQLDEQGYVVVDNVLNQERDLAPVMAEYGDVLDGIARDLFAEGVLASTYADLAVCPTSHPSLRRKRPTLHPGIRHLTAAESRGSRRAHAHGRGRLQSPREPAPARLR